MNSGCPSHRQKMKSFKWFYTGTTINNEGDCDVVVRAFRLYCCALRRIASNNEQPHLFNVVTLEQQFQDDHCLPACYREMYPKKGADLEKQKCLFGLHPATFGKNLDCIDCILPKISLHNAQLAMPRTMTGHPINIPGLE